MDSPIPKLEDVAVPIIAPVEDGPPDVIPGFLPRKGQLVLAGETNVGKSLVALEVCSALITGNPLWGALQPTVQAKKILYVLGEHYVEVIQRLWQVTKLPMTEHVWIVGPEQMSYDKWLVVQGKPNPQAIDKFRKWSEGCDLVVFDPFSAFVAGIDAENDNVQMRIALDTMSTIAHQNDASCLILAHKGKPQMDKQGQEHSRQSYAIRGASAIEDAATNIFYMSSVKKEDGDGHIPNDARVFRMQCRKYKGDAPAEYRLLRDHGNLTHTFLGNRPFHELMKVTTNSKIAKVQMAVPGISFTDAIKVIAAAEGRDEKTVRRWLEE